MSLIFLGGYMQAKHEYIDDINIIYLSGQLTLDAAERLQKVCLNNFCDTQLILSFEGLSFVGSTGITVFLETVRSLSPRLAKTLRMCNLGSEYQKIFSANLEGLFYAHANLNEAVISFKLPQPEAQVQPDSTPSPGIFPPQYITTVAPSGATHSASIGISNSAPVEQEVASEVGNEISPLPNSAENKVN